MNLMQFSLTRCGDFVLVNTTQKNIPIMLVLSIEYLFTCWYRWYAQNPDTVSKPGKLGSSQYQNTSCCSREMSTSIAISTLEATSRHVRCNRVLEDFLFETIQVRCEDCFALDKRICLGVSHPSRPPPGNKFITLVQVLTSILSYFKLLPLSHVV